MGGRGAGGGGKYGNSGGNTIAAQNATQIKSQVQQTLQKAQQTAQKPNSIVWNASGVTGKPASHWASSDGVYDIQKTIGGNGYYFDVKKKNNKGKWVPLGTAKTLNQAKAIAKNN